MGKAEIVCFSIGIMIYDMEMQSISIHMNAKGQGHLVTLAKDVSVQHFQRTSPVKLLGRFQLKFICSLQAQKGRNFIYLV